MHNYLRDEKLQAAAERACGDSVHFEGFFRVAEKVGQKVWQGVVTRFRCGNSCIYAWNADGEYLAVLRQPRISSPTAAVRAWLDGRGQAFGM